MIKVAHKIFYFSGTHWDREWYQTFQGFRINLVRVIDDLIEYFENNDDINVFHLDGQTILLEDYIEVKPENKQRLQKLIAQGKLVIGPWYCMPDEFLVSGEALIRNLLMGHSICKKWGTEAWKVGYICDIFGHISQFPQILKGFEIPYAVLGRGTNEHTTPAFFRWTSPDNSEVVTYKLPDKSGYGSFSMDVCGQRMHDNTVDVESIEFYSKAKEYIDHEKARSLIPVVIIQDAMDHEPLHHEIPQYIQKLKQLYPQDEFCQTNLIEAFKEANKGYSLMPVKKGELNETGKIEGLHLHLLSHTLSSRHSIKSQNDICQSILEKWLEPMFVFLSLNGIKYEQNYLEIAWRHLLQNHPHDSICGCSVDRVHSEMIYRFSQVHSIYEAIMEDAQKQLANGVKLLNSENEFVTILNSLPISREECIEIEIPFDKNYLKWQEPFGYQEVCAFKIYDLENQEIKYLIKDIIKDGIVRVISDKIVKADIYKIIFPAKLNAMGMTSFRFVQQTSPVRYFKKIVNSDCSLDNGKIKVDLNMDGTLTIKNLSTKKVYKNILGLIDDGEIGDGWNSVRPVNDLVSTKTRLLSSSISLNNSIYGEITVIREIMVPKQVSYMAKGISRDTGMEPLICEFIIGLEDNSNKLNIKMTVKNTVKDHRLRLVIPTNIINNNYKANQAFTFIERTCGIDETTCDWKEKSQLEKAMMGIVYKQDKTDTLAFVSRDGLHECGVNNDNQNTIYITLHRGYSKTYTTNGEIGGQELFNHSYNFNLIISDHTMNDTKLQHIQDSMQTPIRAFVSNKSNESSMIEISDNICTSTLKPSIDGMGIILRIYNLQEQKQTFTVKCNFKMKSVYKCNLMEENLEQMSYNNMISSEINPYEIITIKIIK